MERTDHVMLVGRFALDFAKSWGFEEEDLLTDRAREAWLHWRENHSDRDDWGPPEHMRNRESEGGSNYEDIEQTHGTVNVLAVDSNGDVAGITSTSGMSYKIPGRVGDSPIVGAGMFCDNEVGAAGSTGRGESVIQSAASFQVVRNMADGLEPTEACLRVLRWIADHTKRRDLLNERGEPDFQVILYALRKDGACGAAAMHPTRSFTVHDGTRARAEPCATLYEK